MSALICLPEASTRLSALCSSRTAALPVLPLVSLPRLAPPTMSLRRVEPSSSTMWTLVAHKPRFKILVVVAFSPVVPRLRHGVRAMPTLPAPESRPRASAPATAPEVLPKLPSTALSLLRRSRHLYLIARARLSSVRSRNTNLHPLLVLSASSLLVPRVTA